MPCLPPKAFGQSTVLEVSWSGGGVGLASQGSRGESTGKGAGRKGPVTLGHFTLTGLRWACVTLRNSKRGSGLPGAVTCPGHSRQHDLGPRGAAPLSQGPPRPLKTPQYSLRSQRFPKVAQDPQASQGSARSPMPPEAPKVPPNSLGPLRPQRFSQDASKPP